MIGPIPMWLVHRIRSVAIPDTLQSIPFPIHATADVSQIVVLNNHEITSQHFSVDIARTMAQNWMELWANICNSSLNFWMGYVRQCWEIRNRIISSWKWRMARTYFTQTKWTLCNACRYYLVVAKWTTPSPCVIWPFELNNQLVDGIVNIVILE